MSLRDLVRICLRDGGVGRIMEDGDGVGGERLENARSTCSMQYS